MGDDGGPVSLVAHALPRAHPDDVPDGGDELELEMLCSVLGGTVDDYHVGVNIGQPGPVVEGGELGKPGLK